jgi:heme exporter protein C
MSTRFARVTQVLTVLTGVCVLAALFWAWLVAPEEASQGTAQRIFYMHVPLAWTAYLAFGVVFVTSIGYLWQRRTGWDVVARSSAEVGVVLTTLVLLTGSLWAKPIWGTWWTWDARLTTTLVLWLIYLAYLMLRSTVTDQTKAARYAAVLGIIGALDIPFIHYSVQWWRTLHPQAVVLRSGGPSLPPSMLAALLIGLVAFTLLYLVLLLQRINLEWSREHLEDVREAVQATAAGTLSGR